MVTTLRPPPMRPPPQRPMMAMSQPVLVAAAQTGAYGIYGNVVMQAPVGMLLPGPQPRGPPRPVMRAPGRGRSGPRGRGRNGW